MWGDRLRLAQASGNLIANAIEHGGGEVRSWRSVRARGRSGSRSATTARDCRRRSPSWRGGRGAAAAPAAAGWRSRWRSRAATAGVARGAGRARGRRGVVLELPAPAPAARPAGAARRRGTGAARSGVARGADRNVRYGRDHGGVGTAQRSRAFGPRPRPAATAGHAPSAPDHARRAHGRKPGSARGRPPSATDRAERPPRLAHSPRRIARRHWRQGSFGHVVGRGGTRSGKWVAKWGRVGYCARSGTRVAGLLPPSHPGSRAFASGDMKPLDLPRNLRTLARREAPADGAGEVPGGARGRSGAGRLAGDEPGTPRSVAIWPPEAFDAFTTDGARRPATRCRPTRASSSASLQQLPRRRAGLGQPRDDPAHLMAATPASTRRSS